MEEELKSKGPKKLSLDVGAIVAQAIAFLLTVVILVPVQLVVERPMLLAERFLPGGGWIEMAALAAYAAWLLGVLLDPQKQPRWRQRIWLLFSVVFFGQLLLGLAGFEQLLMSGHLHLPIPAVIIAGPIYRGGGLFMVILFSMTLLLAGPAWCSYLCYFGAWDGVFARRRHRPSKLPSWSGWVRWGILIGVVATAWGLNAGGIDGVIAAGLAIVFLLGGVVLMALISRRLGTMVHCTVYCPLGLLADIFGKVSPFRIRIGEGCTECGACSKACRYDALSIQQIQRRRPGLTCSLCGDCVTSCRDRQIDYSFFGWRRRWVRTVFLVVVVALHASFLGVARV